MGTEAFYLHRGANSPLLPLTAEEAKEIPEHFHGPPWGEPHPRPTPQWKRAVILFFASFGLGLVVLVYLYLPTQV
jgi:hypothetical protein